VGYIKKCFSGIAKKNSLYLFFLSLSLLDPSPLQRNAVLAPDYPDCVGHAGGAGELLGDCSGRGDQLLGWDPRALELEEDRTRELASLLYNHDVELQKRTTQRGVGSLIERFIITQST
jgi:hypothetical protein